MLTLDDLSVGSIPAQVFLRGPGITDPALDPEPALLAAINSANVSIYVEVFSISLTAVRDALIAKHNAGIPVHIVTDGTMAKSATSAVPALVAAGIDLRVWGGNYQEMHDKVAIIDGRIVIAGSYNWTALAETRNVEFMLILKGIQATRVLVPALLTQWNNVYNAGATP